MSTRDCGNRKQSPNANPKRLDRARRRPRARPPPAGRNPAPAPSRSGLSGPRAPPCPPPALESPAGAAAGRSVVLPQRRRPQRRSAAHGQLDSAPRGLLRLARGPAHLWPGSPPARDFTRDLAAACAAGRDPPGGHWQRERERERDPSRPTRRPLDPSRPTLRERKRERDPSRPTRRPLEKSGPSGQWGSGSGRDPLFSNSESTGRRVIACERLGGPLSAQRSPRAPCAPRGKRRAAGDP